MNRDKENDTFLFLSRIEQKRKRIEKLEDYAKETKKIKLKEMRKKEKTLRDKKEKKVNEKRKREKSNNK